MDLVQWNAAATAARGRTGTLYLLARIGASWSVSVDGDVLCTVETAASAMTRVEHLEALKHVACGRGADLSIAQLDHAADVAAAMKQASDAALRAGRLPNDDLDTIDLYSRHLGALLAAIAGEQAQRQRARPLT